MSSENPGQTDSFAHGSFSPPSGQSNMMAPAEPQVAQKKSGGVVLTAMLLLAFSGGIVLTIWGWPKVQSWWQPNAVAPTDATETQSLSSATPTNPPAAAQGSSTSALNAVDASLAVATLEARLAAVATKLDEVTQRAGQAGSNAARAEGLMIAFAARRALDRGAQLGYLEGELRLRFADAQPRAVATIINASHAPVTIADLQAGLEDIAPQLLGTSGSSSDWWTATKREFSNLIIIRKANEPSPVPYKVIERVRMLISVGRINPALQEIERLPGHKKAENWLQMARQYNEARRALDVIEAAAILEPRNIPASSPTQPNGGALQVAPTPEEEAMNASADQTGNRTE